MRMLLLTAGAAALLAIHTDAQRDRRDGGQDRTWKFLSKKYDKNRNGKITFKEYQRDREKFESMDQDGDGVLTEADFEGSGRRGRRGRDDRGGRRGDRRGSAQARQVATLGEQAPDFELPTVKDPRKTITLSDFAGKKPVALVFGSYT